MSDDTNNARARTPCWFQVWAAIAGTLALIALGIGAWSLNRTAAAAETEACWAEYDARLSREQAKLTLVGPTSGAALERNEDLLRDHLASIDERLDCDTDYEPDQSDEAKEDAAGL